MAIFAQMHSEASEAGASDAQLAALEAAVSTGEVTVEVAREAARRAVTCMREAGVEAELHDRELSHGVVIPGYAATQGEGQGVSATIEACDKSEFRFLSQAYQLQPSAVEAMEQLVDEKAPALRACLERHGYETDPDATGAELAAQASRAAGDSAGEVTCLADAGIDAW